MIIEVCKSRDTYTGKRDLEAQIEKVFLQRTLEKQGGE